MLVKLFITILFSLVYLTSTSGIVLNAHYCGKKLVNITFTKNDDGNCCGKKKMPKKCCKDKSAFFKLKDNHKIDNSIKISKSPLKVIQNCAFVYQPPTPGRGVHCWLAKNATFLHNCTISGYPKMYSPFRAGLLSSVFSGVKAPLGA